LLGSRPLAINWLIVGIDLVSDLHIPPRPTSIRSKGRKRGRRPASGLLPCSGLSHGREIAQAAPQQRMIRIRA
jgi:hypothetical protein